MLQRRALATAAVIALVASGCSHHTASKVTHGGPTAGAESASASPGASSGPSTTSTGVSHSSATIGGDAILSGLSGGGGGGGSSLASCKPSKSHEIGVTDKTIRIGEVVTDSSQLPQQLGPVHQGLQAFVNAFNGQGGLCGRKLDLQYRNDNLNPATHTSDMQDLANTSLAFVGNDSLLDFSDYDRNPPFAPSF